MNILFIGIKYQIGSMLIYKSKIQTVQYLKLLMCLLQQCLQQCPMLFLDPFVVNFSSVNSYSDFLIIDLAVAPVARLLHFENKPLITMGAVSNEFTLQRQAMYSTLFRFGYRTDELGKR